MPRTDAASGPPSSSRLRAASRISSSVRARRGPRRRGTAGADIGADDPLDIGDHTVERSCTSYKFCTASRKLSDDSHGPGPAPSPDDPLYYGHARDGRYSPLGPRRGQPRHPRPGLLRSAAHPALRPPRAERLLPAAAQQLTPTRRRKRRPDVRAPNPISRPRRGVAGPVALPRVVAREVAAADPPPHRAVLPVGGLCRRHGDRLLRDPVHRPLSAVALRFQRRGHALVLARALLRLLGPRHRPLSALHPGRGAGLSGAPGRPLSRTAVPRSHLRERAAGHSALPRPRGLRRRRAVAG